MSRKHKNLSEFNEMGLSPISLKFKDHEMEVEYADDYYNKSINQVRISFCLALFLYAFLGLLDVQLMPKFKYLLWVIRFSGMLPIGMLVLVTSFSEKFHEIRSKAIGFSMFIFGIGILMMIYIAPKPVDFSYYASMIIIFIFIYLLTGFRFVSAIVISLSILIIYEIMAIFLIKTPHDVFMKINFFFIITNVIGIFGAYSLEFFSRKDFYLVKYIDQQKNKLIEFNEKLENKVKEQTSQLHEEIEVRKQKEIALIDSNMKLKKLFQDTITGLGAAIELRDPYTSGHQERVSKLSIAIAEKIGMDKHDIEGLRLAAKIHDIGKLLVPAILLNKSTELTEDEKTIIHEHTKAGYDLLKEIDFPWPIAEIVYQHHEYVDGSGYPNNLKEEEILLSAKIMSVADVFEAVTCDRSYRPSYGVDYALSVLENGKGRLYNKEIVNVCIELIRDEDFKF
ncbi:MAG: HD domain-containing protein [Candidatus Cloacimonetes bacterium]|nr:HD domain-containing protein [Candidatus Cloacimonadota bacterium]